MSSDRLGGSKRAKVAQLVPKWRNRQRLIWSIFSAVALLTQLQADPSYYLISEIADAQRAAALDHLPLVWVGGDKIEDLTIDTHKASTSAALTQMAVYALQGNAIVIFFVPNDLHFTPDAVRDEFWTTYGKRQIAFKWVPPKLVFTDAIGTTVYGHVSHLELRRDRDEPIRSMLQTIQNHTWSTAKAADKLDPSVATNAPENLRLPTPPVKEGPLPTGTILAGLGLFSWITDHELLLAIGFGGSLALLLLALAVWRQPRAAGPGAIEPNASGETNNLDR